MNKIIYIIRNLVSFIWCIYIKIKREQFLFLSQSTISGDEGNKFHKKPFYIRKSNGSKLSIFDGRKYFMDEKECRWNYHGHLLQMKMF